MDRGPAAPFRPPRPFRAGSDGGLGETLTLSKLKSIKTAPVPKSKAINTRLIGETRKSMESKPNSASENNETCSQKTLRGTESPIPSTSVHHIMPTKRQQLHPVLRSVSPPVKKYRRFAVQWRKSSNRKNKTWDGDGILVVFDDSMMLKVDSTSREMARARHTKTDGIIKLGGYEAEVDYELQENEETDHVKSGMSHTQSPSQETLQAQSLAQPSAQFKSVKPSINNPLQRGPLHDVTNKDRPARSYPNSGIDIDAKLDQVLRPHQKEAVDFLANCVTGRCSFGGNGALLADEMGLGKTLSTIALIWRLLRHEDGAHACNKVLIVCPVTLIANWNREFKKWIDVNRVGILSVNGKQGAAADKQDIRNFGKNRVYNVLIMGYEKVLSCASELSGVNFDLLVCDEGHRLKSSTNKVLKVLKDLLIPRKIVLTGTPIQNDLIEFFTIVDFLNPGILGLFAAFQKNYIRHILRSRDVNCKNKEIRDRGEELSNKLISLTSQFTLRRTSDIISSFLPKKTDVVIFCQPTALQLSLFEDIQKTKAFTSAWSGPQGCALSLINLFKKICNSPSLIAKESKVQDTADLVASDFGVDVDLKNKTSGKLLVLIPLLLEIQQLGEKVVLVSNYTQTLDLLEQSVNKLNMNSLRLDGSTPNKERDKLVNAFNKLPASSVMVFLLSAKAGGVGLNLVGASRLVLFDNDWNPSVDLQAMARIHRDGQERPVFIYRLLTSGCIDEKIFQRQLMKNNLSDKFLDNKADSRNDVFDLDDLKDIFSVTASSSSTHELLECDCNGNGETMEVRGESEDENDVDLTSSQLRWMTALDFKQEDNRPKVRRINIRKALQDYRHYRVSDGHYCEDDAVNEIVKTMGRKQIPCPITLVMTKVTGD